MNALKTIIIYRIIVITLCRIIKVLVEKNPECVHWKGEFNQTPLHKVCRSDSGNLQAAKCLIDNGANVNVR